MDWIYTEQNWALWVKDVDFGPFIFIRGSGLANRQKLVSSKNLWATYWPPQPRDAGTAAWQGLGGQKNWCVGVWGCSAHCKYTSPLIHWPSQFASSKSHFWLPKAHSKASATHRSYLWVTEGINSSRITGFDKGSSILDLLLADSKFSQLGEMIVLETNLFRVDLNSWRAVELVNRLITMRRDNNNSLKSKINPSTTWQSPLTPTSSVAGSQNGWAVVEQLLPKAAPLSDFQLPNCISWSYRTS